MSDLAEIYKRDASDSFLGYKKLAERALEQVSDEEFFLQIDDESNSLAVIVKHIAGNQHSRWRDFLTTDGEKASRDRDQEFEITDETRETLMDYWETGWQTLFDAIEPLTEEDLEKTVTIRGEPHSVVEAINRQLTHYSYHIGQIVFLAKHLRSSEWKTLSVPRDRSAEFNQFLSDKQAAGTEKTDRLGAPEEFARLSEKG
ncbi:MAG TPA: DUF1572 family protein [Pyrinomonadaceae bacterium]|nr:DUF1572 family protein [Pyrinomonadaceae bacterium]HMP64561.1 DUF1572 family protein [Pyrinomonadaceae bacterium]